MRRLVVASIVLGAAGCASEQPEGGGSRWSGAQAVGAPFAVTPYYVTIHQPARQYFVPPGVASIGGRTAIAAWSDLWGGVWAAHLGPSGAWSPPAYLAHPARVPVPRSCLPFGCTPEPLLRQRVALVDGPDGAVAFWQQTEDTGGPGTWTAVSTQGGGWSSPVGRHPSPPGWTVGPVARSAGNQAIVSWEFTSSQESAIWAQRYLAGAPTDAAVRLASGDRFRLSDPAVDVDAAGRAVVVWSAPDGVHARWSSAAGGWGPDRMLPAANTACPVVALDDTGGAIAAWRQQTNSLTDVATGSSVQVARLRPDAGWQVPEPYSVPASLSGCPAIASSSAGHAVLAWANAGADPGLWIRPLGSMTPRKINDVDAAHEVRSLRVAMDGLGNGYVVWVRARSDTASFTYPVTRPPAGTVWASHFVNGGAGWEPPEALQSPPSAQSDVATMVDLAVGADGNAIAFWFESNGGDKFTPWATSAPRR